MRALFALALYALIVRIPPATMRGIDGPIVTQLVQVVPTQCLTGWVREDVVVR
jgi:hypothetical protein